MDSRWICLLQSLRISQSSAPLIRPRSLPSDCNGVSNIVHAVDASIHSCVAHDKPEQDRQAAPGHRTAHDNVHACSGMQPLDRQWARSDHQRHVVCAMRGLLLHCRVQLADDIGAAVPSYWFYI